MNYYTADEIERLQNEAYAEGRKDEREQMQATKLWLWRNHVDGRPEYWAFEHLYPVRMDCGDPQVLGEPCGYALLKPSRPGRTVTAVDEIRAVTLASTSEAHKQLMKFYRAETLEDLVDKQAHHIERLQAKLPPTPDVFAPQRVREG